MPLYLDDGFTLTKTIPARPGFHPQVVAVYRPALGKERIVYRTKSGADAIDSYETDLILRQVISLNDEPPKKEMVPRLHPDVRADLVSLILSIDPPDLSPEELQGNSRGG